MAFTHSSTIAELALKQKLPAVSDQLRRASEVVRCRVRRHPAQQHDAAGAGDAEHVALWLWLSSVAPELAAGPVAGDEVREIIEQHGVRIGRLSDGVDVQNLRHSPLMDRRRFLLTSLAGALAAPLAPEAQSKVPRIGFLGAVPRSSPGFRAFEERLGELGYVDGRSIAIEFRTGAGNLDLLPGLAGELVRLNIDLLVAGGSETTARAARQAAGTRPIVIVAIDYDPIALGYVASLARPGGNITGVVLQQIELTRKRVELLREALPKLRRMGILWDASATDQFKAAGDTARSLGLRFQSLELRSPLFDLASAFAAAARDHADAVLATTTPEIFRNRASVAHLAKKNRLPTMFALQEFAEAGGLMAYGSSLTSMYAAAATFVDKILKGATPAALPVEQPTKFEFVINLKTAKALGLTIPPSLLARADQVIE